MTFEEVENKLNKLTEKDLDKYGQILSKLHKKLLVEDKETADALEIAFQALSHYCK